MQIPERRARDRLQLVEGWRKNIGGVTGPNAPALTIEVWIADTNSIVKAASSHAVLTSEDWSHLAGVRCRVTQQHKLAARVILRLGLSRAVKHRVASREWQFHVGPTGQPALAGPLSSLNFSISHRDGIVVAAIAPRMQIGIDVEAIDQNVTQSLISNFSHTTELAELSQMEEPQQTREFLRCWTRKEAYTKLIGCGHSLDFSSVNCLDAKSDAGAANAHFEEFFVTAEHRLYHASVALAVASRGSFALQLIHVGQDSTCPGPSISRT
jgi:4'-phosphopantetheinyl transferase